MPLELDDDMMLNVARCHAGAPRHLIPFQEVDMTLEEARSVVDDPAAAFSDHVLAANVIAQSRKSELSDLIRCLRRRGLPAETAALALYQRTGRPYSGNIKDFSADPDEWTRYLTKQIQAAAS